MKNLLYLMFLTILITLTVLSCAIKNYDGEKRFYSACIKLDPAKIDVLVIKMKQAYKRTIKSDGSTVEARCKSMIKDINAWGVELNASEHRMNGFYSFLVKQMKEQL